MNAHDLAIDLGATDLFALVPSSNGRYLNVDGVGRGHGWAGNISVHPAAEPLLAEANGKGRACRRSGIPFRAFGPYWYTEVVALKTRWGLVVVGGDGVCDIAEDRLEIAARWEPAATTAAAKMDADALELEQAIGAIDQIYADDPLVAGALVAETIGRSLSCDFAAVLLTSPTLDLFVADLGWVPPATTDEMISAMLPLLSAATTGPLVEQDLATSALAYPPFSAREGLVSRIVLPLGKDASSGVLMAAHCETRARGFTAQCQKVATEMSEAVDRLLSRHFAQVA